MTAGHRLTFVGGKGGVGKTTCSAAYAIHAADTGRRLRLVSTDPAHSRGDALDVKLSAKPRRIPVRRGELHAVELDADRALRAWVEERRRALRAVVENGTYLDEQDVDAFLGLSLPGVD